MHRVRYLHCGSYQRGCKHPNGRSHNCKIAVYGQQRVMFTPTPPVCTEMPQTIGTIALCISFRPLLTGGIF
jgi:hypothetical protein